MLEHFLSGNELWQSDGTENGTVLLKDVNPHETYTPPSYYYAGSSTPHSSNPQNLVNVNGVLYFTADDGDHGRELWSSDGTEEGTVLAADVRSGVTGSTPTGLTAAGGLLLSANDGDHGQELWGLDSPIGPGPQARTSYVASYYDKANRLTDVVNVGTNGGEAWERPEEVPERDEFTLVSSYFYNDAGWLESLTDPRGIVSKMFYDALGRTTITIENYDDGEPGDSDDKTVLYTYDGAGHLLTLTVLMPDDAHQTTEFVYGVTTGGGSFLSSNDIPSATKHPDKDSGDPSACEMETVKVNALGQVIEATDRNGTTHAYSYDVLGRLIADTVIDLDEDVDDTVLRIEYAYDSQGNLFKITSYDAAEDGCIVNQVRREFNGLGQLITEYQSHSGAVNPATTPKVQYTWSEMDGGANHSRLTSIIYPDGEKVLSYNYDSGLDNNISRLSSISDGTGILESYTYLGLATVVRRAHPQPDVDLTFISLNNSTGDAGDQYVGLDRFGRVVDQHWFNNYAQESLDHFAYGYDAGSNRTYRENLIDAAFSELYAYDDLGQLTGFQRGTLNGTKDGLTDVASRSQEWEFDALGNWTTLTTGTTPEEREHNLQNQVTAVGINPLTYDANGNLTTDETGKKYIYDAWNRLVAVTDDQDAPLADYQYDGLGRRIAETHDAVTIDLYYSAAWQVLEERVEGETVTQYVWSPVYVDALILRDRDTNSGEEGLEERLWVQQDANWNVTALVNGAGEVVERYVYDAYGQVTVLTPNWCVRGASLYGMVYLFQGGRQNVELGTVHLRTRELLVRLGRFAQRDRLGFAAGDVNLYRFVESSPNNFTDPSGESQFNFNRALNGAAGGAVGGLVVGSMLGTVTLPIIGTVSGVVFGTVVGAVGGAIYGGFFAPDEPTAALGGMVVGAGTTTVGAAFCEATSYGIYTIKGWIERGGQAGQNAPQIQQAVQQVGSNSGVQQTAQRILINEGQGYLGMVRNGQVIGYSLPNTSHEAFARELGVFVSRGQLAPGVEAFTVIKENGQVHVLGSLNFGGVLHISNEAIEAVRNFFE